MQRHQPPWTRVRRARSTRCSRGTREAQSCQPIFDCHRAGQQYSLTPTTSRKSTKTIKSTRLTTRRRTRRIQSKKSPVEKGRFRQAESDCVRNGLIMILKKKSRNIEPGDQGAGKILRGLATRTPECAFRFMHTITTDLQTVVSMPTIASNIRFKFQPGLPGYSSILQHSTHPVITFLGLRFYITGVGMLRGADRDSTAIVHILTFWKCRLQQ